MQNKLTADHILTEKVYNIKLETIQSKLLQSDIHISKKLHPNKVSNIINGRTKP